MKRMIEMIMTALGLVCFAYSVVIWRVRSGTGFYLVWDVTGVVLILAGIVIRFGLWSMLPLWIRVVIKLAGLIAAILFLIVEGMVFSGFGEQGRKDLDYVIVLGAQVRENGPSVVLKYRLDRAFEYLSENKETICIVSGGRGSNEPAPEAEIMKKYLIDKGISSDRILVEDRSRSTEENISFSFGLIGDMNADIGIITNNFHVFRSVSLAKKKGALNVCGISAPSNPLYIPNNMLREFFAVIKDGG